MSRRAIKECAALLYRASGGAAAVRRAAGRSRVAILVYHDPSPEVLDSHLRFLRSREIPIIPLDTLVDGLHEHDWSRIPEQSVVLTFDDGHRRNADLTPVIERHNASATVYLCSQVANTNRRYWWNVCKSDQQALKRVSNDERERLLLARYGFSPTREYEEREALNREDLAAMGPRFDFASHTRFHPILPTCSSGLRADEIVASKDEIETLTGSSCRHFAYPNGDYTAADSALASSAGYRSARSCRMGWNGPDTDPYELRIVGVDDRASVSALAADLGGLSLLTQCARAATKRPNTHGRFEGPEPASPSRRSRTSRRTVLTR